MKGVFRRFDLEGHETTVRQELAAGTVGFLATVYIAAINGAILADAGIPLHGAIVATILTSLVGCLLMGLWSNAPIILVPGMGVNALFTYTFVQSFGLTWQGALAAVFVSGLIFIAIAFTKLTHTLSSAIPASLKEAITVGIGLFLTFIGLQKGGIIQADEQTFIAVADLSSPLPLATLLTLCLAIILFIRNAPANFLLTIVVGTVFGLALGVSPKSVSSFEAQDMSQFLIMGQLSFTSITTMIFWVAVFSLTMVLVFENIGLINGFLQMTGRSEKYQRSLQANAVSALSSGLFGTSPTVATVETAAGISAGGRTGLTAIVTGVLFGVTLFFVPYISLIPDSAIAPILLIVGGLMVQSIKSIAFDDFSEGFPAFLIIALIPLTYSIAEGIAFGFIAYPILKLAMGKGKDVSIPLYVISSLFLLYIILQTIG
ncbi:NCS2 family permease [Halalkalibacterium ligniniphilum]|uniref:NCS2 family permease n=2 Tax=Halalkalibacterium ligniniphilum TaxID=1134413 RepID=UPI0003455AA2|nr:NCS2 family permease [Halalkalibacterium ligniniphilum]